MAGTGGFAETLTSVVNTLKALGLAVVTDPRNARPLTVFVEAPTFDNFNNNVADITTTVRILAPPPGNQDALDWLVSRAWEIMGSDLAVAAGRPSVALIGEQQLPAYDLTIRLGTRRT